jgi:hypothetical protein
MRKRRKDIAHHYAGREGESQDVADDGLFNWWKKK